MLPSILHARIFNMINAATLYSYSHKTAKNDTKKKKHRIHLLASLVDTEIRHHTLKFPL